MPIRAAIAAETGRYYAVVMALEEASVILRASETVTPEVEDAV